jgi:hypothetical protein
MRRQFLGLVSFCLMLTLIGCGEKTKVEPLDSGTDSGALAPLDDPSTGSDGSAGDASASSTGNESEDAHRGHSHPKAIPGRKTLDGNWLLAFPQLVPPQQEGQEMQAGERAMLLLKVSGAEGDSPQVSVIAGRQGLEQVEIQGLEIVDGAIKFQAENSQGKVFDFSGQLTHGLVVGSTLFADRSFAMSRLLPTEEKTFARIPMMMPLPETQIFAQLATSPVPDEDTRAFVEMLPVSPLGRMAYLRLVNMTAGNKAPADELEGVINEFLESLAIWGDRVVTNSEFEAFSAVAMTSYDVDWCLKKADEIEEKLKASEDFKHNVGQVVGLRARTKYRQTTELLGSKEDADRAKGRELAEEFLVKTPFEPMLSVLLADDARLHGSLDEAIGRYAELAVLPMQERMLQQAWSNDAVQRILPTERVATLWKEKNGSTEGLDEYLDGVYQKRLLSFIDSPVTDGPEEADKPVVLCELFTGSRCAPCVAADVGLEGIENTYQKSQVVTLRYHVHVPGHDPLTNEDCEARFYNYYKAAGTPSVFVDGATLSGAAGVMPNAPQTYRGLRNAIDEFRGSTKAEPKTAAASEDKSEDKEVSTDNDNDESKDDEKAAATDEKTDPKEPEESEPKILIDLKVSLQQNTIQVSATVDGLTAETSNVRLMLALAESDIKYRAFNGIRHHDMVVRQLIGGDRGTSPKDGVLSFEGDVNVEELRDRLHAYLTEFEENQGVEFTSMPLDLANLSVVAFVQNVESRRVLRTVMVPVAESAAGN